ncbi:hypothetical protein MPL3365_150169 [Mesorhizobium plurifarium]|uniref:Uncharacterized protein n=1 Tax=Mesorhizobium plurifarium TaxID=69974 RepID=A0A090FYK8_MESPL|nr:hypothetical protein MPL3365_150169 [Mesorhizobium plurifarium]
MAIGGNAHRVVIHGRSKERSDARRPEDPFRDFNELQRCRILSAVPFAKVTAWIPGSPLRYALE